MTVASLVRRGLSEETTFKENPCAFKGKTKCQGPERRGGELGVLENGKEAVETKAE